MPEIPNVVAGEPVESDWGNDIRDRSTQKYADLTALQFSQPLPQLGELAWLNDPGYLVVCVDVTAPGVWVPILDQTLADDRWVNRAGDSMSGNLSLPTLNATTVNATSRIDGPLATEHASGAGILPIGTSDTVIDSFTAPVTGTYLFQATLNVNWASITETDIASFRLLRASDDAQFAISQVVLTLPPAPPGITTGVETLTILWPSYNLPGGTVFDWTVKRGNTTGGANAVNLAWAAHRVTP